MRKQASPVLVGAFLVGAVALALLAVVLWGSGALFGQRHSGVVYLESAEGLNADSPVKLRGVRIGSVHDLRLDGRPAESPGGSREPLRVAARFRIDVKVLERLGLHGVDSA